MPSSPPGPWSPAVAPHRSRRPALVVAVVALVLAGAGVAVAPVLAVRALTGVLVHDGEEPEREPTDEACAALTEAVQEAGATAAAGDAVTAVTVVRTQDAAVRELVTTVEALGIDRVPRAGSTTEWLTDWRTLHDAREAYADALARGERPAFVEPKVDDLFVSARLSRVPGCEVARDLGAPPSP